MQKIISSIASPVLGAVSDAVTKDQQNTGESKGTSSVSGSQGENLSTDLSNQLPNVYQGLSNIAETTEKLGVPAAKQSTKAVLGTPEQQGTLQNDQDMVDISTQSYLKAVNYANDQLTKFDTETDNAKEYAKIDPKAYQDRLGISGNTIASLGMLISGIGVGITGQPNMASAIFQKNIERDIAAQQATYTNLQNSATQHLKNAQTTLTQVALAQNANAGAKLSILKGIDSLLQSTQAAIGYGTAKDTVPLLRQKIGQALLDTYNQHATLYQNQVSSKDAFHLNAIGVGAASIADHAEGAPSPSISDPNPAQRRGLRMGPVPPSPLKVPVNRASVPYQPTPSYTTSYPDPTGKNSTTVIQKSGEKK